MGERLVTRVHHGNKKKKPSGSVAANISEDNDLESDELFARMLVKRIVGFLEDGPLDFSITILPTPEMFAPGTVADAAAEADDDDDVDVESGQHAGEDNIASSSSESLSREHRSLLESSVVLMHDPEALSNSSGHLGLEARKLPLLARILRKKYYEAKKKYNTTALSSLAECEELFHFTSCLLLIQPDHATAWADRRRCLLALQHQGIKSLNASTFDFSTENSGEDAGEEGEKVDSCFLWSRELDYLDILVTQHSKAPSYWAHRKYALRHMLQRIEESYKNHGNIERTNRMTDTIFAREVRTCIDVAEKFPKNYYAWTHRRYLWDLFSFNIIDTTLDDDDESSRQQKQYQQRQRHIQLLETELVIGMWQEWLQKHPADHSAVHYSSQVLDMLLNEIISLPVGSDFKISRVDLEEKFESTCVSALEQVRILMSKFSNENESLWILRRMTYKIFWKQLNHPSPLLADERSLSFTNRVRKLVRDDLKSILSSTVGVDSIDQRCDNLKHGDTDCIAKIENVSNVHAWTFLAWCIANLDGIDDPGVQTINNNANDIIFSPTARELILGRLRSTKSSDHHNHLVFTSPSSPFTKVLVDGLAIHNLDN